MFAALAFAVFQQPSDAAMMYEESWDAGDTNGWEGNTISSVVTRSAVFGNPAGSLATRRDLSPPTSDIGARVSDPAAEDDYTGEVGWKISFDVYYETGNYVDTWLRFRYQDSGFNGWHLDVADAFPASWESYLVTIDPTWTDGQAAANGWCGRNGEDRFPGNS